MDTQLLKDTLADLDRDLLERDVPVRLLLLGALAGEHVLLVGPPGTAKSELARRLHRVFFGARYFERLLTRFSVPEELFGPLSLTALEQDRYERLTDGFLPTAQVAFLDEVFKANSAILNALLTLLNEREFDNGSGRVKVPLITVVGATNEVPDDEALRAFYDRFLLRVPIAPINDDSFRDLLALPTALAPAPARISGAQLGQLRSQADVVPLSAAVTTLLVEARAWCATHGVTVSDRRWRKVVGLLKVQAATRGAAQVGPWDLWLLPFALGSTPQQVDPLVQWFLRSVALAVPLDLQWLSRAAEAFEKQLDIELSSQPMDDDGAGKLALARAISREGSDAGGQLVRIVSDLATRRYSRLHVQARLAQVHEVLGRALATRDATHLAGHDSRSQAAAHLWLPPTWLQAIEAVHAGNADAADALVERLEQLQQGFAGLPMDHEATEAAPQPIALAA